MPRTLDELYHEAMQLSEADRLDLASLLGANLGGELDPEWLAAWSKEIQRRMEEIENGTVKPVPWEEVRQKLWQMIIDARTS